MRKILCFFFFTLLSILVFLGCTHTKKQGNDTIEFKSGTFPYKDWSETVGTYGKAVIPNKEIAIEVATTIFNGMDKRKEMQEYVPTFVFFDEQDEIWIVSFGKETNELIVGGDCSIAMQKSDGKVLRIWFGE